MAGPQQRKGLAIAGALIAGLLTGAAGCGSTKTVTVTNTETVTVPVVHTRTVTKVKRVVRVRTRTVTVTAQPVGGGSSGGGSSGGSSSSYAGKTCSEIGHSFNVTPGSDPEHDADNDGIACESYG